MSVKVTDTDKGYKALFQKLDAAGKVKQRSLEVGILAAKDGSPHGDSGKTIGEIAAMHEFGIGQPERSFIRSWADSEQAQNLALLRALGARVLTGKLTAEQALAQAGARFAARIQERIAQGIPPPNAESTIAAKGSSTPLIDSGILRSSISHGVKNQ